MKSLLIIILSCIATLGQSLSISSSAVTVNGTLNWSSFLPQAGPDIKSLICTNIWVSNLASGANVVYTCPAGYRMCYNNCSLGTTNATPVNIYGSLQTNSVSYRFAVTSNVGTNNGGNLSAVTAFIYEPTESFVINTDAIGVSGLVNFSLIPTNLVIFSPRILSLSAGDNTLYTAPTGKNAVSYARPIAGSASITPSVFNVSGATRTYAVYLVPPGGVTSITNQMYAGKTVATNVTTSSNFSLTVVPSGYSVIVNSDSSAAGQFCWMNALIEVDQ